jgi:uncharacterized protein
MNNNKNNTINYVELPTQDMAKTKHFFSSIFDWVFTDYGPNYTSFSCESAGLDGGFFTATSVSTGGALLVLHHSDLEHILEAVGGAEGVTIAKPIFSFPGGRRFEFIEPGGNLMAVWCKGD